MPGSTLIHNKIAGGLYAALLPAAEARGCRLFISDVIVRTPNGNGLYPDVFLTCDSSADSSRVIHRPRVVVEVLSPDTEVFDRGEKWLAYQELASLEQYVLLWHNEPVAEVYSRIGSSQKWWYDDLNLQDTLVIETLQYGVRLADLYAHLRSVAKLEPQNETD